MNEGLDLTLGEREVVERAADLEATRTRIRVSLFTAALMVTAVVGAGWVWRSWRLLAGVFVVYIVVTTWERLAYGRAVLVYKSVVHKLHQHLLGVKGGVV